MTQTKEPDKPALSKLREPFPPNQISKLPKETRAQIDARKADKNLMVWKCEICGGPHHKNAVHLDYVGHAAATDRLLDTDMEWSWEPLAVDQRGLPAFDDNGGLWIKLTVCGVTRLGYGSADGKSGGDAKKEIIGDAIRNAGMRFGMALDLWHKGDLHTDDDPSPVSDARRPHTSMESGKTVDRTKLSGPHMTVAALKAACAEIRETCETAPDKDSLDTYIDTQRDTILQVKRDKPDWWSHPDYGLDGTVMRAYQRIELETDEDHVRHASNLRLAG